MKRRKWTSEMKSMIVLSGLRRQSVAEICNEHGISQSQYYQWRDQFMSNASKALDKWISSYNTSYLHSTLDYMPPEKFEANFNKNQQTETLLINAC